MIGRLCGYLSGKEDGGVTFYLMTLVLKGIYPFQIPQTPFRRHYDAWPCNCVVCLHGCVSVVLIVISNPIVYDDRLGRACEVHLVLQMYFER